MKSTNYLKPLTDKCRANKCNHKKCNCGHCSQYHLFVTGGCCKINMDLTSCDCDEFIGGSE